jgi:hypothetical protein
MFIKDLMSLINNLEKDPLTMIVIMMDANTSIEDTNSHVHKIFEETTLVDTFYQCTKNPCTIPTYARGSKRIDFILTSQNLIPFIQKVGYLSFYEYNDSDHRGAFIDIDDKLLDNKDELQRPPRRFIGLTNPPDTIYRYKQYIEEQFAKHRIYDRSKRFYELSKIAPITGEQLKSLNNLDILVTEIILVAEKHVYPRRQTTSWSIAIDQHSTLCKFWATITRGVKDSINTQKQSEKHYQLLPQEIQEQINKASNYRHYPTLKHICFRYLRKATKELKDMIRVNRELRHQCLLGLQEIRKAEGNSTSEEIIRKIIRKELHDQDLSIIRAIKNPKEPVIPSKQEIYQKQLQHINPTFHPPTKSSLNTLEVPDKDQNQVPTLDPEAAVTWKTITDPIEIEEKLLARNIAHFGQSEGTLFTTQRLQQRFGYCSVSHQVDNLLKGMRLHENDPNMTTGATTLLDLLSNKNKMYPIDDNIDFKLFVSAFRKWSEKTSTSPSSRHLGHY